MSNCSLLTTRRRERLVKRPRACWRDSGLLHAVLHASDARGLLNQPWVGANWEGSVLQQILSAFEQCDCAFGPYFLRTSDQYQIDLLLELSGELWAVQVKLTANPTLRDIAHRDGPASLYRAEHLRKDREHLVHGAYPERRLASFYLGDEAHSDSGQFRQLVLGSRAAGISASASFRSYWGRAIP